MQIESHALESREQIILGHAPLKNAMQNTASNYSNTRTRGTDIDCLEKWATNFSKKRPHSEVIGSARVSVELAKTTVTVLVVVLATVATSSAKSRLVDSGVATPLDAVVFVIAMIVLVGVISTMVVKSTELGEPPPIVIGTIAGSKITIAG